MLLFNFYIKNNKTRFSNFTNIFNLLLETNASGISNFELATEPERNTQNRVNVKEFAKAHIAHLLVHEEIVGAKITFSKKSGKCIFHISFANRVDAKVSKCKTVKE